MVDILSAGVVGQVCLVLAAACWKLSVCGCGGGGPDISRRLGGHSPGLAKEMRVVARCLPLLATACRVLLSSPHALFGPSTPAI